MTNVNLKKKKVKYQSQKVEYKQKGLITRITHVKYQSSSTHCSKVISEVKISKNWVKFQGHRDKNNGTHGKVLSQGILM